MSKRIIVRGLGTGPQGATGPTGPQGAAGPQGLPGVGSLAWVSGKSYTAGQVVMAPDGSIVKANTTHTSGTAYTSTNWTSVAGTSGTQENADLHGAFVSKAEAVSVNDATVNGVLTDSRSAASKTIKAGYSRVPAGVKGSPYATARPIIGRQRKVDNDALYNAFPGIAETTTGRLVITYMNGTGHDVAGQQIMLATSDDRGATFTNPIVIFAPTGNQRYKAFLPKASGDVLYGVGWYSDTTETPSTGAIFESISSDNGATWSAPTAIVQPFSRLSAIECSHVVAGNGNWLIAAYGSDSSSNKYSVKIGTSTNQGASWTWASAIVDGVATDQAWTEPTLAVLPDGSVQLLIRNTTDSNIYRATSSDSGATWSTLSVAFANGGRPTQVVTSMGTVIVLVRQQQALGDGMMRFSRDNGATWSGATTFTNGRGVFAYAHAVEVSPGVIAVATAIESSGNKVSDILFGYITEPGLISPLADADFARRSAIAPVTRAGRVIAWDSMDRADENPADRMDSSHAWINWGYGHKLVSGRLKGIQASTPTGALTAFDLQRSDYHEVVTSVLSTASFTGGIVFQMADNQNFYLLNLSGAAGSVVPTLYKWESNTGTSLVAGSAQNLGYNIEYPVRITIRNGRIKCFVDDEKVIDFVDTTYTTNTHVGVRAGADSMEFGPIAVLT